MKQKIINEVDISDDLNGDDGENEFIVNSEDVHSGTPILVSPGKMPDSTTGRSRRIFSQSSVLSSDHLVCTFL